MDIRDVALFRAITSAGTLSEAARQLGLPPMTVSRRLAGLEAGLGVRLFHRTTRSIALTPEGESFLPFAVTLLETHDAALEAIRADEGGLQGVLKVTAPNVIGRSIVVPALTQLMADNPSLKADLTLTDGVIDLVGTGLDLAIRVSPLASSELIATQLAPNPRVLCASPDYIDRFGTPTSVNDLAGHSCITLHRMPRWPFDINGETIWLRVDGPFTSSSVEAVRGACLEGAGIAMMTYWDVRDCLESGSLRQFEFAQAPLGDLGIWAVYPTRQQTPQRIQALIAALRNKLTFSNLE